MSASVTTQCGEILGLQHQDHQEFRGIPYAEQPIGVARFKAPEPLLAFDEPYQATCFKDSAPQEEIPLFGINETSEDCLYLNIWTPNSDDKKRPVLVWIHGGAYVTGSGSQSLYDGKNIATKGDMVVITLNYRLGALGYLYLNDLLPDLDVSPNNGLLDQIEALKWIKENIIHFGGNPQDVTLAGESAGAMSIATLLACPMASGLFHKVILQSGAADQALTRAEANEITTTFLKAAEVSMDHPEKLWQLSTQQIVKAQRECLKMSYDRGTYNQPVLQKGMTLLPVMDGEVLAQSPLSSLTRGDSKNIPMMIGCTRDEWNFFMKMPGAEGMIPSAKTKDMDKLTLIKLCERDLPGMGERAANLYEKIVQQDNPGAGYGDIYSAFESDRMFRIPSLRIAEAQCEHNPEVYFFQFEWSESLFGACHASDIPFVFGNTDEGAGRMLTGGGDKAKKLSSIVQSCWIAFARSSDPATDLVGKWPKFTKDTPNAMIFDQKIRIKEDPFVGVREIWERIL